MKKNQKLLILVAAAGAAYWWFKIRKPTVMTAGQPASVAIAGIPYGMHGIPYGMGCPTPQLSGIPYGMGRHRH